jgi:hypothetical protein
MSVTGSFLNKSVKLRQCSIIHPKYGQCIRMIDIGDKYLSGFHISEITKKNRTREWIEWSLPESSSSQCEQKGVQGNDPVLKS